MTLKYELYDSLSSYPVSMFSIRYEPLHLPPKLKERRPLIMKVHFSGTSLSLSSARKEHVLRQKIKSSWNRIQIFAMKYY